MKKLARALDICPAGLALDESLRPVRRPQGRPETNTINKDLVALNINAKLELDALLIVASHREARVERSKVQCQQAAERRNRQRLL